MKGITIVLMLLFVFLTSALAVTTPRRVPSSNTALNLSLLTNASDLASPIPPPGYEILLQFDETILLNPLGVYINALELMYRLAQFDWDLFIYGDIPMSATTYNIWIVVASVTSGQLKVSYAVIALHDSIIAMARLPAFFRLSALISLDGQRIGHLEFGRKDGPSDSDTSISSAEDTLLIVNNNQSEGSWSNSGQIVDPYDSKFIVTYDFYGKAIDSKEIFTVALDGLAISAQFKASEDCPVLEASSMSGVAAISISKVLGVPTQLRYSDVTKSLLIIVTGVIVPQRKFKEVEFSISYDGVKIAEGYMLKLALGENVTKGIAASKREWT